MPEEAINKQIRHIKDKTAIILDKESYNVGEARGKFSSTWDFFCIDKMGYKFVKVCLNYIDSKELKKLLEFNDSPDEHRGTILQLFFWESGEQQPFYRIKLFYNSPKQVLPEELKKLVK